MDPATSPSAPLASLPPASPPPAPRRGWKRFGGSFLVVSVVLHLLFGAGATLYVVQRIQAKRQLAFHAGPPNPMRSQRQVEHRVQVAKQKQTSSAPAPPKRVAVAGLAKVSLPEMPAAPVSNANLSAAKLGGMGGAGGFGLGPGTLGGGAGPGGTGGGVMFFGLREKASKLVLVVDISGSMIIAPKNADSYQTLERELTGAINGLGGGTRFGLIAFSGASHRFRPGLSPAVAEDKENAVRWLKTFDPSLVLPANRRAGLPEDFKKGPGLRHAGTRTDLALRQAFEMDPDVILLASDGEPSAPANPQGILDEVKRLQGQRAQRVKINVVAYRAGDGQKFMRDLALQNNGTFKEVR